MSINGWEWIALRLLTREIPKAEIFINCSVDNPGSAGGRPRGVYMISFNQFEELMIAAQTTEGKKARMLVLILKRILQEYIVAEHEAARASEAARANALQQ